MVKHARHSIDMRMCNAALLNVTNDIIFGGIDEVKGISCDCRHQKILLYTHLIRIWTNNNHLKIFSWLKYKSFHVYGTLKIFHLFSRKKR